MALFDYNYSACMALLWMGCIYKMAEDTVFMLFCVLFYCWYHNSHQSTEYFGQKGMLHNWFNMLYTYEN